MHNTPELSVHEHTVLADSSALSEALKSLDASRHGAVVAIDAEGRVTGVVSLGDIRRALTRGATETTLLRDIANQHPIVCHMDVYQKDPTCSALFAEYPDVMVVPVVDEKDHLIGTVLRP
jgi:arabinose-5-phosphate isomerase